jgi:hypothetical protein
MFVNTATGSGGTTQGACGHRGDSANGPARTPLTGCRGLTIQWSETETSLALLVLWAATEGVPGDIEEAAPARRAEVRGGRPRSAVSARRPPGPEDLLRSLSGSGPWPGCPT